MSYKKHLVDLTFVWVGFSSHLKHDTIVEMHCLL